jgi:ribosome-associated heat shock protein Hsp15
MSGTEIPGLRLDKWLVHARFARTRSLARDLVADGRVRVDGARITAPDRKIRPGCVLTLALPHATTVVRVLELGDRRGPATQARLLYEEVGAGQA